MRRMPGLGFNVLLCDHTCIHTSTTYNTQMRVRSMLTLLAIAAGFVLISGQGSPIVNTTLGPIRGTTVSVDGVSVNVFRGVPFAASTGGDHRFLAPQPREPWTETLNCTENGPGCIQPHHNADVPCGGKDDGPRCQSEDCLNLNIYCPAEPSSSAEGYPVMFWIYGGAFNEGMNWGPLDLYDGSTLAAQKSVCIVATNYRLGVLGYLVTPEQRGNQGLLDQRAAMVFTRDNIRQFGGNPSAVTIWGESAGAMSVGIHLTSPGSQGLFHRAIMESNVAGFQYQESFVQQATFGVEFAKLSGCGSLTKNMTCLRALSARDAITFGEKASSSVVEGIVDRILEGGRVEDAFAMQWAPVIDGVEVPSQPLRAFETGDWAGVPLVIGTNQDEGATFVFAGVKDWLPELLFPLLMKGIFGERDGAAVESFYANASASWHDARDSLSYVLTDFWFKCASERIAAAAIAKGKTAYVYRFDHVLSFPELFPTFGLPTQCENRTCHASEIPFVFQNHANFSLSKDEMAMAADFSTYWTSFASTGDPNAEATTTTLHWPAFNTTSRLNMRMGVPRLVESTKTGQIGDGVLPTRGVCAFFDSIGYSH